MGSLARRWPVADLGAICVLALVMRAIFQHAEPDTDPTFALLWGRDILHGHLPDFSFASAPTAHPLPTLESVLVAPLGTSGAADAILGLSSLCLGAILWGTFRLGEAVFSRWVGLLALVLLAMSFATVDVGLAGFLDVQFIAIVLWAAVLEVRAPRRGTSVLLLLMIAGLLRPEGWLLAGVYWLYAFNGRSRRVAGGLLVVAAPLAWVMMDLVVTGQPLFAFTNARHSSEGVALGGYGHDALFSFAVSQLRNAMRAPVLVGGLLGLLLALRVRTRASKVPAAILLLLLLVWAAFIVLRLPVPNRMLLTPAVLFALFCAFAAVGWVGRAPEPQRRIWAAVGTAILVLLLATTPAEISRLRQLDQRRAALQTIISDLQMLNHSQVSRTALASCRTLTVGAPDVVPYTSYYLERPLQRMRVATLKTPATGAYLALANDNAARFVLGHQPQRGVNIPSGFRLVAVNRSWRLFASDC